MSILHSSLAPLPLMIVSFWHQSVPLTSMLSVEILPSQLVLPANNPPVDPSFVAHWKTLYVGPLIVTFLHSLCDGHNINVDYAGGSCRVTYSVPSFWPFPAVNRGSIFSANFELV